jgi:TPR repeat protein
MTKLVRCREGHVFDLDQNTACPKCGEVFASDDETAKKKDVPSPEPVPVHSNGLLQLLLTFPLNAVVGGVLVVLACSAWYLTSQSPSAVRSPPVSVAVTTPTAPSEQATPPPTEHTPTSAPSDVKAANAPTPPAEAVPAPAPQPGAEGKPAQRPAEQAVVTQTPQPTAPPPQPPQEGTPTPSPAPGEPTFVDTGLDPMAGARFMSDKSPAQQPTHRIVLEQAAEDFAIGMRGKTGVVAALVCEDPSKDRFGSGAITVWMYADGNIIDLFNGQPAPSIKVDGVEFALDLSLRIDGQEFTLTHERILTVKNGHRLVADVAPTEALFSAMKAAKRVEIVGDSKVYMVETGGRFDELAKIVESCKRIAGVTTGNASTAKSGAPVSDATIAALEDKYTFTPLARELLATAHGFRAYTRKDYAAAKAWLTSDVAKRNPAAIFYIAEMVAEGNGFQQNAANALGLYAESANEGFYLAQLRLGKIFNTGDFPGVARDPSKAKPWLIMAAKEDRGEANRILSEMGVPRAEIRPTRTDLELALGRSYQEAFNIANTLVSQGSGSAYYWAGSFIHDGQGTDKNPDYGRELIAKGARTFDALCIESVAEWSFNGEATTVNIPEAVTLAYIARENAVFGDDVSVIDKRTSVFLDKITDEQYEEVRQLLTGIRDLPARQASR